MSNGIHEFELSICTEQAKPVFIIYFETEASQRKINIASCKDCCSRGDNIQTTSTRSICSSVWCIAIAIVTHNVQFLQHFE